MYGSVAFEDQDLAPADIALVVSALLEGINRGELDATEREVDFLASVVQLLEPAAVTAA